MEAEGSDLDQLLLQLGDLEISSLQLILEGHVHVEHLDVGYRLLHLGYLHPVPTGNLAPKNRKSTTNAQCKRGSLPKKHPGHLVLGRPLLLINLLGVFFLR